MSFSIGLYASSAEKLYPSLTIKKFWKFYIFAGDLDNHHRVLRRCDNVVNADVHIT